MKNKIKTIVFGLLTACIMTTTAFTYSENVKALDKSNLQTYQIAVDDDVKGQCDESVKAIMSNINKSSSAHYIVIAYSDGGIKSWNSEKPLKCLYNEGDDSYIVIAEDDNDCTQYSYSFGSGKANDHIFHYSSSITFSRTPKIRDSILIYSNYNIGWYTYTDMQDSSTYVKQSKLFYYGDEQDRVITDKSSADELGATDVQLVMPETYTICIPKILQIDTATNTAAYAVKVSGDIAIDKTISVVPDASATLNNGNGLTANAVITQEKTAFTASELDKVGDTGIATTGKITSDKLSAGDWTGTFNFNISIGK